MNRVKLGWKQAKMSQRTRKYEHCVKLQIRQNVYKQLTIKNVNCVWSGFFGVFWHCFIDQQVYLFFCHESKPFCHPDIDFNVRLLKSVLKTGEYSRIFPSFSWGIFGHVTGLDQSRASENIWWIIMAHSRSFLANQKARNAIVENLLKTDSRKLMFNQGTFLHLNMSYLGYSSIFTRYNAVYQLWVGACLLEAVHN